MSPILSQSGSYLKLTGHRESRYVCAVCVFTFTRLDTTIILADLKEGEIEENFR